MDILNNQEQLISLDLITVTMSYTKFYFENRSTSDSGVIVVYGNATDNKILAAIEKQKEGGLL